MTSLKEWQEVSLTYMEILLICVVFYLFMCAGHTAISMYYSWISKPATQVTGPTSALPPGIELSMEELLQELKEEVHNEK